MHTSHAFQESEDPDESAMRYGSSRSSRWPDSALTVGIGVPRAANGRVVAQILAAATQAVAECGLDGLNMEDIVVRTECSRATIYRRVGGIDAVRRAVLLHAIERITASVATAVDHLAGDERVAQVIVAALDTIRTDPVSAALLTSAATGESVGSALITQFNGVAAELAGFDPGDEVGCELITRVTLSLLCWPAADPCIELAMIRRYVANGGPEESEAGTVARCHANGFSSL